MLGLGGAQHATRVAKVLVHQPRGAEHGRVPLVDTHRHLSSQPVGATNVIRV